MTFNEWLAALGKYHEKHPGQRAGQAAFNYLYEVKPELANTIRATNLDPFYADSDDAAHRSRVKRFYSYVEENWGNDD